jgi:hypothetical protein
MRATFRYNRRMPIRSLQRFARKQVTLGLMVALALSGAGCEALGVGTGKPPPLPRGYAPEGSTASRSGAAPRKLQAFSMGGPGVEPTQLGPEPVVAARAAASGGSGTLNGNPNGLSRETLNSAIQGTMGLLATCFSPSAQNPMVALSFEADPSGRASLVRVSGAPPDAERCVRNVVQNMRFPRFEGDGVHVDLPLTFHQVGRSQPSVPSGESKGPSEAPLFIQP